ncbi:MAG: alpha/beta-type small acid-soluble spore protein [Christensenellales bacterium]
MSTSSSKSPKTAAQRQALEQMKMEVAGEVGVNLKQGYNGDITSREAGSIGGGMVKKMYEKYVNKNQQN